MLYSTKLVFILIVVTIIIRILWYRFIILIMYHKIRINFTDYGTKWYSL